MCDSNEARTPFIGRAWSAASFCFASNKNECYGALLLKLLQPSRFVHDGGEALKPRADAGFHRGHKGAFEHRTVCDEHAVRTVAKEFPGRTRRKDGAPQIGDDHDAFGACKQLFKSRKNRRNRRTHPRRRSPAARGDADRSPAI